MILTIDNHDGAGARNYTAALESERLPKIMRKLNRPTKAQLSLISDDSQFVLPAAGGRIRILRADGHAYFTGYLTSEPEFEYLGWGQYGPVYRYLLEATGDEWVLDRKRMLQRPTLTSRTVGAALKQITEDILPGAFDTTRVQDLETQPVFSVSSELSWSEHAAELTLRSRAVYRLHDGVLSLKPLGGVTHSLNEADENTCLEPLKLTAPDALVNDLTLLGQVEPRAYIKNYFLGDGLTSGFILSHTPFIRRVGFIFEEEFKNGGFNPALWVKNDPTSAMSVVAGKLQIQGGNGIDGQTLMQFVEQIQLGGAIRLQHGEVEFSAATNAVIGGLYSGPIQQGNCLAGFRISAAGVGSSIQPVVNGSLTGAVVSTTAGHRYALTTRMYNAEPYRMQQLFHSSVHPAGSGRGGAAVASQLRIVLEVHDIDPANPGTLAAASTILYDGILNSAPGYCLYALVNALDANCSISFASMTRGVDAEVRSTVPGFSAKTRLAGNVAEGAECTITQGGKLVFFSPYIPVSNESIILKYRSAGRALARVVDSSSIAAQVRAGDDGVRATVRRVAQPAARNSADCENAASAVLDDSTQQAWAGEYECLNDLWPGGPSVDPLPGETIAISAPNRNANFSATIRQVALEILDPSEERCRYKVLFANDAAETNSFEFQQGSVRDLVDAVVPGTSYIANIPDAEITSITSTTVVIDTGTAPPAGGGIEVRRSDGSWDPDSDRNLVGRFSTQSFTVPRLARVQTYYLKQFDGSTPRKYSRYSTVLYVDYPF
jgi:hypothetical protein